MIGEGYEEILIEPTPEPTPEPEPEAPKQDFSRLHPPASDVYEQKNIKDLLYELSNTSPYKDENKKIINEDYLLLKVQLEDEILIYESENSAKIVVTDNERQEEKETSQEPPSVTPVVKMQAPRLKDFSLDGAVKYIEVQTVVKTENPMHLYKIEIKSARK